MFEEELYGNPLLLIIIIALYVFCSVVVGLISQQFKLRFIIGFVWSIIFTPVIGLFLVYKSNPAKREISKRERQKTFSQAVEK
jgi:hypothetical protein